MARKPEPLLVRVARGLRITPDELTELILQRTNDCLLWRGYTKKGKPYLKNHGNPARALYAITVGIPELERLVYIRNGCGIQRCINPWHQNPIGCEGFRYMRAPGNVPPLPRQFDGKFDEEEVQALLEIIHQYPDDLDHARACSPTKEDYDEAIRRYQERA